MRKTRFKMMPQLPDRTAHRHPCRERPLPGVQQAAALAVDAVERDRAGGVAVEPPDENRDVDVDHVLCSW